MVFLKLIFRPLSREPTHAHYIQRGNKIFIITYNAPHEVYKMVLAGELPI